MKLNESEIKQTIVELTKIKYELVPILNSPFATSLVDDYIQRIYKVGYQFQEEREHPNFFNTPTQFVQYNKYMVEFYELMEDVTLRKSITGHSINKLIDYLINALGMLQIIVMMNNVYNFK